MADELIIPIKGDDSDYEKRLKNIKNKTKQTVDEINDEVAKSKKATESNVALVTGLNKTAKKLALTAGAVGTTIIGMGISYNSQIEQYTAGFTTMLGSAEKANDVLQDLRGFAEKTPFELTDLANASTTLLAFGESAEELMPDLKMLGDISLGNQEKFKSLALVFGQVRSQGRLMGQDLLQMINAGFNPLQVISEKTGESVASLKDKMSEGRISFEMVAEAMKVATSEGGQFYNAMETQSKTLSGQWSTLKDNVISLTGDIASDISKKLTDSVLPKLIKKVEELKEAWTDGKLQETISKATASVVSFGIAIAGLNLLMFIGDMVKLVKGVKDFTTATKLGKVAQDAFNSSLMKNPWGLLAVAIATVVSWMITYALTVETTFTKLQKKLTDIKKEYDDVKEKIYETVEVQKEEAEQVNFLKNQLYDYENQLKNSALTQEEANEIQAKFKNVAAELEEIIPGISDNLYDETGQIDIQRTAVNNLCDAYYDLMVAKAKAAAAEELIKETSKTIIQLQNEKKKNEELVITKSEDLGIYSTPIKPIWGENNQVKISGKTPSMYFPGAEAGMAQQMVDAAQTAIDTYTVDIEGYREELRLAMEEIEDLSWMDDLLAKNKKDNATGVTSTVKSESKKQSDILKEQQKEELSNLQYKHKIGKLSDKEYYEALIKHRDTYFKEGSSEWQNYTLDVLDYTEKLKENIINQFNEMSEKVISDIEELEKTQQSFADKLKKYGGDYYIRTTTVKPGDSQKDIVYKDAVLNDLGKQNEELRKYSESLEQLKQRGEIPREFFSSIRDLSVEEGTLVAEAVLDLSDEEFKKYIADWQEKQGLSDNISKQMYADEFAEMERQVDNEFELLKKKFEDEFGKLPDNFFDLGVDSGNNFGEAFLTKVKQLLKDIQKDIEVSMSSVAPVAAFGGTGGTVYNYSSSYTLLPAKGESTQTQLSLIRNAELMAAMRGGY